MGVNRLAGSPWHTEYIRCNDARRHRSRCSYFQNPKCTLLNKRCFSSSHCEHYVEGKKISQRSVSQKQIPKKTVKPTEILNLQLNKDIQIGNKVIHNQFGMGTIIYFNAENITISFDYGEEKTFKLDFCIKNDLLYFLN